VRGVAIGIAAGALLATTAFIGLNAFAPQAKAVGADTYRELNLFGDVFEKVRRDYVDQIEDKQLVDSAINGMLTSLDPHSSYMDADAYKDMQVQTKGEFGGIGIEVTMEDNVVKVVSPIDDTPAARAGLKAGDKITHINGEAIVGLTLNDAVEKMRGPVNSTITIRIARDGVPPFDVTLKRDIVRIKSVKNELKGDIGYLRVTTFNEQTDVGLEKAIATLNAKAGKKLAGYVLDLRNNPGGLLDQAIAVCDAFLDGGEVVSTRGRQADDIQRWNAHRGDLADAKPIVVLINGGSASASEIVAGALQDHQRATIMGTRSFGKGSVQTIIPLNNGADGAMRLTTARYYTPSGRSIQAKGIDPDVIVEQPNLTAEQQAGGGEATLPKHLPNPTGAPEAGKPTPTTGPVAAAPEAASPPAQPQAQVSPATGGAPVKPVKEVDVQLNRAIEYLHSVGQGQKHVAR
jgi:carboxyl-terminal processing protease